MDNRRTLCIYLHSDRCQNCRDTCSDVLSEQNEHRAWERDHTGRRKRLQNTDRCRRWLDHCRKKRAYQNTEKRIVELRHQTDKRFRLFQRRHCRPHHIHSHKKNTKSGKNTADMMYLFTFDKHDRSYACDRKKRSDRSDIKSNELTCNRRSDIGSHDHPYRLF